MLESVPFDFLIDALGMIQCLFFAGLLASVHRQGNPANRFLIGFLLVYAISFLDGMLDSLDAEYALPILLTASDPFDLLLAPLIYFYVDEMINGTSSTSAWPRWRHLLLPFAAAHVLFLPYYLMPAAAKIALFIDDSNVDDEAFAALGISAWHAILALFGVIAAILIFFVQVTVYLVISIRIIRRHGRRIRDVFSNLEKKTLNWLQILIFLLAAFWLIYAPVELADIFLSMDFSDGFWSVMTVLELVMIYSLGMAAMRQPAVFVRPEELAATQFVGVEVDDGSDAQTAEKVKYAKSALGDADSKRILGKITNAMSEDQLYLDSGLTLPSLAEHTGISANYISQVINEQLNCNFFEFVNQHRIDAAKNALLERRDSAVLDIALDVGFNSKSTFNAAFKRFAGTTPSQFRKADVAPMPSECSGERPSL